MIGYITGAVLGAILGGLAGHFGKCAGGACPLTSTPWSGALVGGLIGLLLAGSLHGE